MTGPDHYAEAERLMAFVEGQQPDNDHPQIGRALKLAHVHAMLAVAAATVDAHNDVSGITDWDGAFTHHG